MSSSLTPTGSSPGSVAPVSFLGQSGIDFNAVLTQLQTADQVPVSAINANIASHQAAQSALVQIGTLIGNVQTSLAALSDPALFNSVDVTSSNPGEVNAQGSGNGATPGTYTIQNATVATATTVTSNVAAGQSERATITQGPFAGQASDTVPLVDSFAAVTPSNGSGTTGQITIDGVSVKYNVGTDSLDTILTRITTAVDANADANFTLHFVGASDTVELSGSQPITIGSAGDTGNLVQVLKLDNAQINNSGPTPTVIGTSGVGGINESAPLNGNTSAGFATPVTSGTFTINGVSISVSASGDNVASILAKINASAAGVTATFDPDSNRIALVNNSTGAQSIVLGASGDTSNFLSAAGLTGASGATTTVGQQAQVQITTPTGATKTIFSNSNTITTIAGLQITLNANVTTPVALSVSQDTTRLVSAFTGFVSAFNAAITQINVDSAPPVVVSAQPNSSPTPTPSQSLGAGVLFENADVSTLRDQLTNLVGGFLGNDPGVNSLSTIGLSLSDSFSQLTTNSNGQSTTGSTVSGNTQQQGAIQQTTFQGTDGTLQPLNTQKLLAQLQKNPNGVQSLVQGANGLATQLGGFLTTVTGLPTLLSSGPVGQIPTVSILGNFENTVNDQIASLQNQAKVLSDNANLQIAQLRAQLVQADSNIVVEQNLQTSLASFFKGSGN